MDVALLNHDTRSSSGSDVESDVEDTGLKARKPRQQFSSIKADKGDGEPSDNNTYLHKYGGAIEDLNIKKALNSVQYVANNGEEAEIEAETAVKGRGEVTKKSDKFEGQIMEEEVVELEFEKVKPKLHTHTMHCPNCKDEITRVILRRRVIRQPDQMVEQQEKPMDLLGCFSCFSFFIPSGNCLSIFRVFPREPDSKHPKPENNVHESEHAKPKPGTLDDPSPIQQGDNSQSDAKGGQVKREDQPHVTGGALSSHYDPNSGVKPPGKGEARIDIGPTIGSGTRDAPRRLAGQDSTSFEILKSIVYGGLMEVIASLSIVASAAAGDATTLNIVALALANLIGGVFVVGHNLWDLRDDCYKFSTQQTSNDQEARNKYKELLGSVEHFPLHAFFAILSFLVFGVIPPAAYGYAFHETNDRDFTMLVVAVASYVCVGLLAIFKAYIDRCTGFSGYVKTITYYLTTAVAASGVSYAVGNLVERLIEELGLFETGSNVTGLSEVASMNPSLAYY
ncbi:hypothetical protein M8C21_017709 [Ambrosia artemisiifolia]|uniref:Membrane protein of ER body-like protein n=1 Tax=Ambrosia artemisiifolia TaxID=4212 RepID=A0AAD5GI99_AMBAR|nr:hypothetical protein M8C21_017709 [Ambrosia artemisiifolia]